MFQVRSSIMGVATLTDPQHLRQPPLAWCSSPDVRLRRRKSRTPHKQIHDMKELLPVFSHTNSWVSDFVLSPQKALQKILDSQRGGGTPSSCLPIPVGSPLLGLVQSANPVPLGTKFLSSCPFVHGSWAPALLDQIQRALRTEGVMMGR